MEEFENSKEVFLAMKEIWDEFESEHMKYQEKAFKRSATNARRLIRKFPVLVKPYLRNSIDETKRTL